MFHYISSLSYKLLGVTYIHTYIRLLTTSPKGLFSANYREKDKNKNIYNLFKVTIALVTFCVVITITQGKGSAAFFKL